MTSPSTGQVIDLNALSALSWEVAGLFGDSFNIRACGNLSSSCGGQVSGVCQDKPTPTSFGVGNSTITIDDDIVTLAYINGAPCANAQPPQNRTTFITFYCTCQTDNAVGPTLAAEGRGQCNLFLNWATPLVCSPDQLANCPSSTSQATYTTTTIPLYTTTPSVAPSHGGSSSAGVIAGVIVVVLVVAGAIGYLVYRRYSGSSKKTGGLSITSGDINMDPTDKVNLVDDVDDDAL